MPQIHVILIDDDTDLGNLTSMALRAEGYKVHFQNTLAGLKGIIEEFKPSVLVLDVEIGEEDGIVHAKEILKTYPLLPILFISSHTDIESITRGVRTGGMGYIRKPFDVRELKIYIERFALVGKNDESFAEIGRYALQLKTHELFYGDKVVKQLSPHEFTFLRMLLENKNGIVPYEILSDKVWGKKYSETEASMNNLISKLRKLLENDPHVCIQTVKNIGYKLIC